MPKRALVVEDEDLVRWTIVDELMDAGWEVQQAESGDAALSILASEQSFDLLFTDIRMPGKIDGWRLAELARSSRPTLPVIYASGHSPDAPRQVDRSVYLAKPFDPTALMQSLRALGL
jgi:CheY-like chemotaxis protein